MGAARTTNPGTKPGPRFPFRDLELLMMGMDETRREQNAVSTNLGPTQVSRTVLAEAIGVRPSQIADYIKRGMTFYAADRAATKCGLHPLVVWPDWADKGAEFYDG